MMRTHIVMPKELLAEVDKLVGPRKRSAFVAQAAAEKLTRLRLKKAARNVAGSLANRDIAGWESSEGAASWVHGLRVEADERRKKHHKRV